jgi:pimeloyl-ACP methyl ester carboxylesterase
LRGARSRVISADAAAELATLIPDATWSEVPDAGHTIQSSNPVALVAEVIDFLGVVAAPPFEGSQTWP